MTYTRVVSLLIHFTILQIPVAIEMIQTSTGIVYYVCDQSVLGDKPQGSDVPVDDSQTDN